MMHILGVDPGASGGIALVSDKEAEAWKIPETERDIWDLLSSLEADKAYIERVHSSPQMGVKSAFTFGQSYGMLRAFLIALGIPFESVSPAVWQKNLGCLTKGDKNVSKKKAQELYPSLRITHATADSILIATFGWRRENQ